MDEGKKISFRQKNPTMCPICRNEFYREEMFTGGGRLIVEGLTDELRRIYKESKKYGKIYPLAYLLNVCPNCLYTAYPKDFSDVTDAEISKLQELRSARWNAVNKFFGDIDFRNDRDLMLGAASYMLAVDCYNIRRKNIAPTFKKAVSALRAAWLFSDLAAEDPESHFRKMSLFFYKKAYEYYLQVIELLQNGNEPADMAGNMGPDADKNWGYEGILYIMAVLTVKIGSREKEVEKRIEHFNTCKKYLSRLFGAGKASKSRPSDLLERTRDLYDKINEMLAQWEQEKNP
ncbi:MAG TPA: DUF2225 domain-containing protein [Spirochaetota bacterium]|jgi:uncharacterized protein (DUF2225 family)|nr:DUF2225 domain-containing protein [Spirochaetota bacterium]HOK02237.1 DUF2225 domain-containing protein [Spirochaetota bacterium]HOK93184.1 DUF2225 domain-containing protein [Spirochaetota bacterium]HON15551.1 DUF2225 domain-containing protein [Spirochaetota bacterium]HPD78473.1 DUF2225 domain-containing protein [Spirochaetota bacterium]